MIGVFIDQHMSQQAGSGAPALNRARRQCSLCDPLAARTGHARAHDPIHHKATRNIFQFLGDILTKAFELAAAGGAGIAHFQNRLIARQMIRQWAAFWLLLLFGIIGRGLWRRRLRRSRNLFLFKREFKLVEAFRA